MVRATGLTGVAQRETPESATYLEHFGFREFMPGSTNGVHSPRSFRSSLVPSELRAP